MNLISTMRLHEICRSDSFLSRASDNRKPGRMGGVVWVKGGEEMKFRPRVPFLMEHCTSFRRKRQMNIHRPLIKQCAPAINFSTKEDNKDQIRAAKKPNRWPADDGGR